MQERVLCMYTIWNLVAIIVASLIKNDVFKAFIVFNTFFILTCTQYVTHTQTTDVFKGYSSLGITDKPAIALTDFIFHILPLVLVSPWLKLVPTYWWLSIFPLVFVLLYYIKLPLKLIYYPFDGKISSKDVKTIFAMYLIFVVTTIVIYFP